MFLPSAPYCLLNLPNSASCGSCPHTFHEGISCPCHTECPLPLEASWLDTPFGPFWLQRTIDEHTRPCLGTPCTQARRLAGTGALRHSSDQEVPQDQARYYLACPANTPLQWKREGLGSQYCTSLKCTNVFFCDHTEQYKLGLSHYHICFQSIS